MSALELVQIDFQDYVLRGRAGIEDQLVGTARVPVATRLGIYSGAYGSRLADALGSNFPVLKQFLGDEDFHALAAAYVRAHDSPYFSIRRYGDRLPEFLATHAGYGTAPVLAEMARWEWSLTEVFDAPDATPLGHEALEKIAPEQWAGLRFSWHPSLRRLALSWNVPQIWQAITEEREPPAPSLCDSECEWLLWRRELTSFFRSLSAGEAHALDAARKGWPFGELCELLCEELGEEAAPLEAATLLRSWIASGLIVGADQS